MGNLNLNDVEINTIKFELKDDKTTSSKRKEKVFDRLF